ncbi:MAG: hypothetical protein L6R37_003056 [Teloschistes peruensis]|nr:MAG: hypothetical protein L6R37_003056 [Teloschistes peruensis]
MGALTAMFLVGVTKVNGAARGYSWGIHNETGNMYVAPRKKTGRVPEMLSKRDDRPFSNAARGKPTV